jgi:hypothetical protein
MISPEKLYADISPDKTQYSAASFLIGTVIAQYPCQIDYAYSHDDTEFKGTNDHAFIKVCRQHGIGQKFSRINRPSANQREDRGSHPCSDGHAAPRPDLL